MLLFEITAETRSFFDAKHAILMKLSFTSHINLFIIHLFIYLFALNLTCKSNRSKSKISKHNMIAILISQSYVVENFSNSNFSISY